MKHLGEILKKHIEANALKKQDVAIKANITPNYLSTIFNNEDMDCSLWERLCLASGLNPAVGFETESTSSKYYSDISAQTVLGSASVTIGNEQKIMMELLAEKERVIAEKERTIQILLGNTESIKTGQKRDNCNE